MQAILSHVFNRLQRLEADMSVLQAKEKDLRTIMADGFAKADDFHIWVRSKFEESGKKFGEVNQNFREVNQKFAQIDQRFIDLEDQIDTLATQTNICFDSLEKRMDKTDARIDVIDNKFDILDQRTKDTNLKIDKILTYLAIA